MPRISDLMLQSVVYLYPSAQAARESVAAGGTGFLIGVKSEAHPDTPLVHVYAVTNYHVVSDYGSPVIRLNTVQDDTYVKELTTEDWIRHPDGDDIAMTYLGYANTGRFKYSVLRNESSFITEAVIEEHDIGPGDDVFVVGRFVGHGGTQRNEPSVRFGNISMMPSEPIVDFYGHPQKCFLVEVRALRGSSGSPVMVQVQPFTGRQHKRLPELNHAATVEQIVEIEGKGGVWLLGIAFSDVPYEEQIVERVVRDSETVEDPTNYVAYSNSGLMAVIPAWRIRDFMLNDERFIMTRKADDKEVAEIRKQSVLRPTGQKAEENVLTREGFKDMLERASRKISQPESESDET